MEGVEYLLFLLLLFLENTCTPTLSLSETREVKKEMYALPVVRNTFERWK